MSRPNPDPGGVSGMQEAARAVGRARRAIVVTGAGVSVSGGIPDFRSSNGLYTLVKHRFPTAARSGKDLFDATLFSDPASTRAFYCFISELKEMADRATPTPAHRLIRDLDERGSLVRCYTQNIDGLEGRVGFETDLDVAVEVAAGKKGSAHGAAQMPALGPTTPAPARSMSSHSPLSGSGNATVPTTVSRNTTSPAFPSMSLLSSPAAHEIANTTPPSQIHRPSTFSAAPGTPSPAPPPSLGPPIAKPHLTASPEQSSVRSPSTLASRHGAASAPPTQTPFPQDRETHHGNSKGTQDADIRCRTPLGDADRTRARDSFTELLAGSSVSGSNGTSSVDALGTISGPVFSSTEPDVFKLFASPSGFTSTSNASPLTPNPSTRALTPPTPTPTVVTPGTPAPLPSSNRPPLRVVQLHGNLSHLVCFLCRHRVPFSHPLHSVTSSGEAPPCPRCEEERDIRRALGKRERGVGRLRPDVVLYNEVHERGDLIADLTSQDLRKRPDLLLVMGTSLKIPGVRRLVKDVARAVRAVRGGATVLVNATAPGKEWDDVFDHVVVGEADGMAEEVWKRWREGDQRRVDGEGEKENIEESGNDRGKLYKPSPPRAPGSLTSTVIPSSYANASLSTKPRGNTSPGLKAPKLSLQSSTTRVKKKTTSKPTTKSSRGVAKAKEPSSTRAGPTLAKPRGKMSIEVLLSPFKPSALRGLMGLSNPATTSDTRGAPTVQNENVVADTTTTSGAALSTTQHTLSSAANPTKRLHVEMANGIEPNQLVGDSNGRGAFEENPSKRMKMMTGNSGVTNEGPSIGEIPGGAQGKVQANWGGLIGGGSQGNLMSSFRVVKRSVPTMGTVDKAKEKTESEMGGKLAHVLFGPDDSVAETQRGEEARVLVG
ncbi:DHS-like NAD/FAD-binding domain-containing protein [Gonapodya prolifera JEL478]|uniref:DHS-like NAD/FAD-binding domain-containing protein n=1 Tax=Gonapodya prolifera (strain JEL478) TaxID=1344416 RepID=A0A139AZV9_GONPJ|nr:DHS-like NAD/FAD-binding domain-containing protein [Gonapodya prolifera JEL478]|eukprot:KXS22093.1 DHS-like NAD/FAD-binding domain-containing protein [Gonapodya prolifera JEL478]